MVISVVGVVSGSRGKNIEGDIRSVVGVKNKEGEKRKMVGIDIDVGGIKGARVVEGDKK